jgi:hypothetical protein
LLCLPSVNDSPDIAHRAGGKRDDPGPPWGYQVIVYAGLDPVTGRQRQIARQVWSGQATRCASCD